MYKDVFMKANYKNSDTNKDYHSIDQEDSCKYNHIYDNTTVISSEILTGTYMKINDLKHKIKEGLVNPR